MRSISTAVMAAAMSFLLAGAAFGQATSRSPDGQEPKRPTLTVTGRGEVMAEPDRATIRLGAVAQAPEAAAAQNQVSSITSAATKAIAELGIPKEQIQTASLMLHPVHEHPRPMPAGEAQEPRIIGYRASNTLQIVVDDLTKLGPIIDAGVKAGVNQMEGLTFELKDDLPQRKEALQAAVRDARTKAEAMAAALEVKLGGVAEASERQTDSHVPFYGGARMMAAMEVSTPVQPGQVQITAEVSVTYRLRD